MYARRVRLRDLFVLGLLAALPGARPALAQDGAPVVFAAASLKNALDEANAAWAEDGHAAATVSYAASSALARQIESGAPADLFASADLAWMDYLAERDLIRADSRVELLGNDLVLVAPADSSVETTIAPNFPLRTLIGEGRLAMANFASVPAGKYGRQALETLGVWNEVEARVAQAENVRAALLLVSRGEAPLGIVYRTDAVSDPSVRIVATFPANSHDPIVYPFAVTTEAGGAGAQAFLDFLKTPKAAALFEKQGFKTLGRTR